jgi:predicted amidophosphoribosyltransferase
VRDCPNCAKPVDDGAALCSHCGFDIHSQQADTVRRLREEGVIHPGRQDCSPPNRGTGR